MFGFGKHRGKKKVEITVIEETVIVMDGQIWYHEHHHHPKQKVQLALTTLINNFNFRIMDLNLATNQFALGQLGLIDTDTQQAVSASFANAVFTSSDPAIFTASPDSSDPNTCRASGVAAGSANLAASADVTYTDSKTGQPVTKNLTVNVTVVVAAVQPSAENVGLTITFGAPQNQ